MMRFTSRRVPGLVAAGLFVALAFTEPLDARAQPRPGPLPQPIQPAVAGGGTELFRAVFDLAEIKPVRALELRNLEPGPDLIVVVLGQPNQWQHHGPIWWARETIAAGGAALVATDYELAIYDSNNRPGDPLNPINRVSPLGHFIGETISFDARHRHLGHRGDQTCPYAVPVSPDEIRPLIAKPGRVWNVFRGLDRITTNQPTFIKLKEYRSEYKYPLARFPEGVSGDNGTQFIHPPLLATGGDGPPTDDGPGYSFLAVADSSIFINQMILEPGTHNRKLAYNTVEYLRGPSGERKRCVFFENGRVVEQFDQLRGIMAPPRPPVPPEALPNVPQMIRKNQDKLVEMLDAQVDNIQKRDVLQNALVGPPGSERERRRVANWIQGLTVALALVVGRLFVVWFFRVRNPQDTPPPPNTGAGAASTGPPGVFGRRQKEMVRRNNVYEPVKEQVREFFASTGVAAHPGPRMPTLDVSDEVRKPDSLRQALRDLWRLAYG
ncbi:MAG TPA: hypothetical protein VGE74_20950, partial [Gemmata sp.]